MTDPLKPEKKPATLESDAVLVQRFDLEQEHRLLIARIQQLRRLLGYPPLATGKQRRREQELR